MFRDTDLLCSWVRSSPGRTHTARWPGGSCPRYGSHSFGYTRRHRNRPDKLHRPKQCDDLQMNRADQKDGDRPLCRHGTETAGRGGKAHSAAFSRLIIFGAGLPPNNFQSPSVCSPFMCLYYRARLPQSHAEARPVRSADIQQWKMFPYPVHIRTRPLSSRHTDWVEGVCVRGMRGTHSDCSAGRSTPRGRNTHRWRGRLSPRSDTHSSPGSPGRRSPAGRLQRAQIRGRHKAAPGASIRYTSRAGEARDQQAA